MWPRCGACARGGGGDPVRAPGHADLCGAAPDGERAVFWEQRRVDSGVGRAGEAAGAHRAGVPGGGDCACAGAGGALARGGGGGGLREAAGERGGECFRVGVHADGRGERGAGRCAAVGARPGAPAGAGGERAGRPRALARRRDGAGAAPRGQPPRRVGALHGPPRPRPDPRPRRPRLPRGPLGLGQKRPPLHPPPPPHQRRRARPLLKPHPRKPPLQRHPQKPLPHPPPHMQPRHLRRSHTHPYQDNPHHTQNPLQLGQAARSHQVSPALGLRRRVHTHDQSGPRKGKTHH